MAIKNCLAGVAVSDLGASTKWYERILESKPDSQPMPSVNEWKFDGGGWVQVFEDLTRAGRSSVTFTVSDFERELSRIKALGIDPIPNGLIESDIVKVAIVEDPDGNRVVFAQALNADIAQ